MLYFSLIVAGLLLLAAHAGARPAPHPVGWGLFAACSALFVLPACSGLFFFPAILSLGLLLTLGLALWPLLRTRVRSFLPLSAAAFVVSYGTAAWFTWGDYRAAVRLREKYPMESMADRVPEPIRGAVPIAPVNDRLTQFDNDLRRDSARDHQLRRLHHATVETFVASPGFGVMRGFRPFPTERSLSEREGDRPAPPPQPHPPGSPWLDADPFEPAAGDRTALDTLHLDGVIDFVNREGWGYVRSRREVAGFLSHAFSRVPESKTLRVNSIELVGLLRHADPVVYLTPHLLPAMADAATAPTRAPDYFETTALAAIRAGDDGFAGRRGDEVRFVGAVRSAAACVACHGGERGDLLGAFSYRLRPVRE